MQNRSVLISGIGIAGATLAYWLGEHGFKPTLVERASHLRTSGYVIDFWGLGYDIAERMGLLSGLKSEGYDVEEVHFVDAEGRREGGFGVDIFRSLTGSGQHTAVHDMTGHKAILHREFDDVGWECPRILAALDASDDVYFDRVSQIQMNVWSRKRVALVGDAAFCPSLLAGQGAALAMISAYVVAGELGKSEGRHEEAFRRYEQLLRPFITAKQGFAERFASSFAPKTRFGLFLRNQITKAFALPFVATRALSGLLDRIDLPDYATQYCNGTDEAERTG